MKEEREEKMEKKPFEFPVVNIYMETEDIIRTSGEVNLSDWMGKGFEA